MRFTRNLPAIAAAALLLVAAPAVLGAQSTGLEDMVGARAGQAEGELQERGYRNIRAEKGDDRSYSYWWNAEHSQCVSIATMNGRYDSITPTLAPDCQQNAAVRAGSAHGSQPPTERDYGRPGSGEQARLPMFNGSCPGDIEVHADEGGPIYLNGREARLKRYNDRYYEASDGRTTVSVSLDRDGRVSLSYTRQGAGHGVCQVKGRSGTNDSTRRPPPPHHESGAVAIGDLPRYCKGEASARFDIRPDRITANAPIRQRDGYLVQGWFDQDKGTKFFTCRFDADGRFQSVY